MKNLCVSLFALLFPLGVLGQDVFLMLDADDDLSKIVDKQHLFSKFTNGRVIYKDNSESRGNLNYNMLLNELQFIQNKDTLSLANPNDITKVIISNYTLVNLGKGFGLVIGQKDTKQLAAKVSITVNNPPKNSGYGGIRNQTSSTTSYSHGGMLGTLTKLPVEVQIKNEILYYIVDENKANLATKKNFLKMFSKHKSNVEQYIKQNKTNFSNEIDLEELFAYCTGL